MTKKETIQVLQSIEDRAVDFPHMTACDWVAIAAAKRHLENSLETKEADLNLEITLWANAIPEIRLDDVERVAKHFFELGLKAQEGE